MSVSLEQPMRPYLKALGESLDNTDASVAQLAQDLQTLDGELDDTNTEVGAIAQNVQGLQRQMYDIPFEYVRTYDTVAEMQEDDNLLSGMVCHTNGFHAAGDGGAVFYTIGTTGTANGMDVLTCANSLIATLIVTESYITPEMFGAYGDGTHDDTSQFSKIFNTGLSITLKTGATYLLNSNGQNATLVLKDGVRLDLNGAEIVSNYKHTFRNYDVASDSNVTGYDGNGNIQILNGTIKHACMTFAHADGITINDVHFLDSIGIHAVQLGGCKEVLIDSCLFEGIIAEQTGTYEAINIECMDYTGQPYYAESSAPTYDLTPTKDVYVKNCIFRPDANDATYASMGDAVGTHYAPTTTVDGATVATCGFFTNINVLNCDIEATKQYSIRCNNWQNSVIDGNLMKSQKGIQCDVGALPNDRIRISNNRHVTTSTGKAARILNFKSGDNTNFSFYGNTYRVPADNGMVYFNAQDNLAQGAVSFSKCDGVFLISSSGVAGINATTFTLHDAMKFSDFNKLEVHCGVISSGTNCVVPIYAYPTQSLNTGGTLKGVATNSVGTLNTVTITDEHTLTSDTLNIRFVMGFV